jgi:hypothetical protein
LYAVIATLDRLCRDFGHTLAVTRELPAHPPSSVGEEETALTPRAAAERPISSGANARRGESQAALPLADEHAPDYWRLAIFAARRQRLVQHAPGELDARTSAIPGFRHKLMELAGV